MKEKFIGKGAVRAGKEFTLFVWNDDTNHVFKILKSLKDSNELIDGITETVKQNKKAKRWISSFFVSTLTVFIQ